MHLFLLSQFLCQSFKFWTLTTCYPLCGYNIAHRISGAPRGHHKTVAHTVHLWSCTSRLMLKNHSTHHIISIEFAQVANHVIRKLVFLLDLNTVTPDHLDHVRRHVATATCPIPISPNKIFWPHQWSKIAAHHLLVPPQIATWCQHPIAKQSAYTSF